MTPFNIEHFTRRLIAESLFYDEEYDAYGSLSLIDAQKKRERFIALYQPDIERFTIEEATEWEESVPEEEDEVGYAIALDTQEYGSFATAEEVANVMLDLAREHGLQPSVTLLFEDDEEA